jgi:hypothetical protein
MSAMASALVHIGTHKTGTSAFQEWAETNRRELQDRRDIHTYQGLYGPNHFELAMLCMRSNRTMTARRRLDEWRLDEWRAETREHVAQQVAHPAETLLVTAEALSLLRYEDEVEALARLLQPRRIQVAVCLREPTAFLASYRKAIRASRYPSSHRYVEPDTWLIRWEDMLSVWRGVFGDAAVVSFGYEDVMARCGSSIPGVLTALGLATDGLPSWEGLTSNVIRGPDTFEKIVWRLKRLRRPSPARRQT